MQPPQLNYPPDTVPRPANGTGLESQYSKGGISRLAPRGLAPPLQSLPPILHMKDQDPISGYSKGARGLSVQSRVSGIFTAATVSPSSCRRQQSSRYTIRAGRNLPDKEFRSSSPHVAMRLGPYLHLIRRDEMAGVWPLRIPGSVKPCGDSSSRRRVRCLPTRWARGDVPRP